MTARARAWAKKRLERWFERRRAETTAVILAPGPHPPPGVVRTATDVVLYNLYRLVALAIVALSVGCASLRPPPLQPVGARLAAAARDETCERLDGDHRTWSALAARGGDTRRCSADLGGAR